MRLSLGRIAEFTSGQGEFDHEACPIGYSIDSRTVQPGELFVAVKGERLDGHDYVEAAMRQGAVAAVIARQQTQRYAGKKGLIVVEDTLLALQTLGAAMRRLWNKPLIAVTGSAGKTSTKDAIAHLLAKRFRVLSSQGNMNNHFGLPLQLLKLEPQHEMAVVELGMSHSGEIAALARIARPDAGVVTCVAPVHLENFNDVADIARAKFELIESLPAGGLAVLNADDAYVSQFGRDFHGTVVTFGIEHPADVRAEDVQVLPDGSSRFRLVVEGMQEEARLPLIGKHNIMNALAAAAVALQYKLAPSEVVAAMAGLQPAEKRGETLHLAGATLINDCYNSNPVALRSMVDALAAMQATRRIAVAGEMLELGPAAEQLHAECGSYMAGKVDVLIGVRGAASSMVRAAHEAGVEAHFVPAPEDAGQMLAQRLRAGDVVLFKASRGVRLEKALETLQQALGVRA